MLRARDARWRSVGRSWRNPALIDRTLALVGGQAITLSDARAAIALGLIDVSAGCRADRAAPRPQLVDRAAGAARSAALRAARPGRRAWSTPRTGGDPAPAAGRRRVASVLRGARASPRRGLRAWVRDDLRTQAYLAQRFASASLPSDAEVSAAYTRQRAEFDKAGQTFEQAAPIVRERLIAARRARAHRRLVVGTAPPDRRRDPRPVDQLQEVPRSSSAAVEQRVADHRAPPRCRAPEYITPHNAPSDAGDDRRIEALQRVPEAEREAGDDDAHPRLAQVAAEAVQQEGALQLLAHAAGDDDHEEEHPEAGLRAEECLAADSRARCAATGRTGAPARSPG